MTYFIVETAGDVLFFLIIYFILTVVFRSFGTASMKRIQTIIPKS